MYLSQLLLNPRERNVQRDLSDPYMMHKTLARGWGQGNEYEAARVLFRVEEAARGGAVVLVQSKTAPDWSNLPDLYLLRAPQMKEWEPQPRSGQILAFRLRANPTVKRDGKRWGLYGEREVRGWLQRKASQHGFEVPSRMFQFDEDTIELPDVDFRPEGVVESGPGRTRAGHIKPDVRYHREIAQACSQRDKGNVATERTARATFAAVRFDGQLRVTDPNALRAALENGIGSGKGMGFGLLSVARV